MKTPPSPSILFICLIFCTLIFSERLSAQNVGIGVASPLAKLHIGGNTNTLRLEGISSVLSGTHITAPAAATDKLLFVNSNGDFKAMPNGSSGQVLTISGGGVPAWTTAASGSSWSLTGNTGTTAGTNFIGTIDAVDWVVKTSNAERLRIDASGNVGINSTPSATERFIITDAIETTTLRVNTTNTSAGSKALHANGTTGTDTYLGYIGSIVLSSTTVTNPGIYSTVSSGSGELGAIVGVTSSGTGSGVYGYSTVSSGGRFTNAIGTAPALVAANQTASGTGNGSGVAGSTIQSTGFGAIGVNLNTSGTGVLGIGNNLGATYIAAGSGGAFNGAGAGIFSVAKTAASGTGIISLGNNLAGYTTLTTGSGGAFNGSSTGLFALATTAATGTGTISLGNNLGTLTTLTGGGGGAFNGTTNGAFGYATAASGLALYGLAANATSGVGVAGGGNNTGVLVLATGSGGAFTATSTGVLSIATTVASGVGVLGAGNNILTLTTPTAGAGGVFHGNAIGLYSRGNTAASGTGVVGVGNNGAAITTLTAGSGGAFTGTGTGAFGLGTTVASGIGVFGVGNNIGTYVTPAGGAGGAFNGTGIGSYSLGSTAASGIGVVGLGNNITTLTSPTQGAGGVFNGNSYGSYAIAKTAASGIGVAGLGNNLATLTSTTTGAGGVFNGVSVGSFGFANTAASGIGVMGAGNNITTYTMPVDGSGVNANGDLFGITAYSSSNASGSPFPGAPARAGGYFESGSGAGLSYAYVASEEGAGAPRKIVGNGTVNTVVKDINDEYVLLSAPEAPENLFMDYGSGELINGKAHINLDPIFAKNIEVSDKHPLRVFVQLEGDCKGVYVVNKSKNGFDVIELQNGNSNVSFTWNVVANRANDSYGNFADERFPHHQGPLPSVTSQASITQVLPQTASSNIVQPVIMETTTMSSMPSNQRGELRISTDHTVPVSVENTILGIQED